MKRPANLPAFLLVGMKGLEPSRLAARAPKARVYTNFTTSPYWQYAYYEGSRIILKGLGHILRPRNFTIAN
jgi:hypothetical protein